MSSVTAYCPNCGLSFQTRARKGVVGKFARMAGYTAGAGAIGVFTGGAGLLALGGLLGANIKNAYEDSCTCPKCGASVSRPKG